MDPALPPRNRLVDLAAAMLTVLGLVSLAACRSTGPAGPEIGPAAEANAPQTETRSQGATANDETYHNTVRWSTASEVDNFGFDVYRSESEEGPFVRVNPEIIEGGGTTDEPRYYEFVDTTIDPRKVYFYYVESISMSGRRERFTPVGKAPAKVRGSSEPARGVPDRPSSRRR